MPQYFIVWNAGRTEGFITDDANDALAAQRRDHHGVYSTVGGHFAETYEGDKLSVQEVTINPELSERAKKLYDRIRRGHWYKLHAENTPKAMQELIDHGLVRGGGRIEVMTAAYVALDHTPFVQDRAPDEHLNVLKVSSHA